MTMHISYAELKEVQKRAHRLYAHRQANKRYREKVKYVQALERAAFGDPNLKIKNLGSSQVYSLYVANKGRYSLEDVTRKVMQAKQNVREAREEGNGGGSDYSGGSSDEDVWDDNDDSDEKEWEEKNKEDEDYFLRLMDIRDRYMTYIEEHNIKPRSIEMAIAKNEFEMDKMRIELTNYGAHLRALVEEGIITLGEAGRKLYQYRMASKEVREWLWNEVKEMLAEYGIEYPPP